MEKTYFSAMHTSTTYLLAIMLRWYSNRSKIYTLQTHLC